MSKVSIIIPVYNAEKFLPKCLDSIIRQTYQDIEIICVNDGSKDNSLKVLQEYKARDSRIVIIDKINAGVSEARNDGIKKSTGEYIMFVDSDDWLELDAVESVYTVIREKNVDMVGFNYYIDESYEKDATSKGNLFGLDGKIFSTSQSDFSQQIGVNLLLGNLACAIWSIIIKRDILLKTSLFVSGIHYAEDCILYNELLAKIDTIYFYDKPLYHYYQNLSSCTKSSKFYLQNIYSSAKAYEKLLAIIEKDRFEKEERKDAVILRFGNIITNFIFLMSFDKEISIKEFILLIQEIMEVETIRIIIEKVKIDDMPKHIALPFKLLRKRKYKMLGVFYFFRRTAKGVRDKIK